MTNPLKKPTVADALEAKLIEDTQLAPDGSLVAFAVADRFKLDTRSPKCAIWVVSAAGGDARQFTSGLRRDHYPRWSPDSQSLAFLSDRLEDGHAQIYLLPRSGGEAAKLTSVQGGIEDLRWAADGREIFFLMEDPRTEDEKMRESAKDDAIEFEAHPKYWHVYAVDVATQAVRQLTHGDWHAWEFDLSADGKRMAFVAAVGPFEWSWYQSRISVASVETGVETILHQSRRQLARPLFSPDGSQVAFITSTWSDRGVTSGDLCIAPTAGGETRNLTPGFEGSVSWMEWSNDGRSLLFLALEGTDATFSEVELAGGHITRLWSGPVGIANSSQPAFSISADRQSIAVALEAAAEPREVWLARRAGSTLAWQRLTQLSTNTDGYESIAMESISWKAPDGLPIQGFLLKPHGYDSAKRYPMVTAVHGGPTSAYTWAYPPTYRWVGLLAANGFVVLLPNPRGSTGRGLTFAEANGGDMGGKDFQDVMAGVEHCIAAGIADELRLGVAGWSYGGFMTMWTVSQTNRFKAAMAGAGISHWKSFHGLTKYPTWDSTFYGTDAYDTDGEAPYMWFSPLTHIKRIKTPTLIVHGERDLDVPVGQAYEFYRALKDHGVETQLVVYPREPHGFSEKAHVLDLWSRIVRWFSERL